MRRMWNIIGHHNNPRDGGFFLTVQRDAVTKVIQVSLGTYAKAESGEVTTIQLAPTKEDIAELERKANILDTVRAETQEYYALGDNGGRAGESMQDRHLREQAKAAKAATKAIVKR
jgi:hypothetical protein